MHEAAVQHLAGVPVRQLKVVHTKAKTDRPWLVVAGYHVTHENASGQVVQRFQAETIMSDHPTRSEAVAIVRHAGLLSPGGGLGFVG